MEKFSCAECPDSMAKVKGESLLRIACANCQQAQEFLQETARVRHEFSLRWTFGLRCPQCGKWCWTKSSLANHREAHGSGADN